MKKFFISLRDIIFLHIYPAQVKEFNVIVRILLYLTAAVLFYFPIAYNIVLFSKPNKTYALFFLFVIILHAASRFVLYQSKRIHKRFSTIRSKKKIIIRTLLIIDYIALMWLVYLLYPITCILFPSSMLLMFVERLFGLSFFYDIFLNHTERFIFFGCLISYVLFVVFDGYRKLQTGFLPDYLGLYAILTASSGLLSRISQIHLLDNFHLNGVTFSAIIAQIFNISNYALNIISSLVMLGFAIYSLYTSRPPDDSGAEKPKSETH